jgi:hypothetical protein
VETTFPRANGQSTAKRRVFLAAVLLILAVLSLGTGIYIMVLRPPLLPEDARVIGISIDNLPPAFSNWLSIVFRTWGGFIVGFSLWLLGLAVRCFTGSDRWIDVGAALALLFAFGSFLVSNVQLRSDSLWFIALLAGVAVVAAALLVRLPGTGRG